MKYNDLYLKYKIKYNNYKIKYLLLKHFNVKIL